jgi:MYXO-CTERM domain-containing protein
LANKVGDITYYERRENMKKKLSLITCTALIAMTLGTSVFADNNNRNNVDRVNYNDNLNTRNVSTTADINNDNDTNWEWIGLLGLVGLLGLRRRERDAR